MAKKKTATCIVKDIKRQTRGKFSSEEKIRIVLEGLKGESSVATICRREGIALTLYYREQGEVKELKSENSELKEAVAELLLQNRVLKKSTTGFE